MDPVDLRELLLLDRFSPPAPLDLRPAEAEEVPLDLLAELPFFLEAEALLEEVPDLPLLEEAADRLLFDEELERLLLEEEPDLPLLEDAPLREEEPLFPDLEDPVDRIDPLLLLRVGFFDDEEERFLPDDLDLDLDFDDDRFPDDDFGFLELDLDFDLLAIAMTVLTVL
ncbi:hypothetical protein, conserved [Angomonas deanei]|uniref:Uncharacterized protein n=1 Tax=Angomonas deanei TaxID=59799 RepID=A0A7G2C1G6_9TRYP|nr:hypothetical protein, conserved [Angomonas deanei]